MAIKDQNKYFFLISTKLEVIYKRNFVLKKTNLILNSLMARYLNLNITFL